MRKQNYYDVLELDHQAPPAQIKSQYRRLAKRFHPDLNPGNKQASQHFLEVQAAYDVLSDPDKRRDYDQTLSAAYRPGPGYTGNGSRPYRRYDARPRQRPRSPGRPFSRPSQPRAAYSQYTVELSLADFFKGARRPLIIGQTFSCGRCRGSGRLENGLNCERCGGYGFVVSYRRVEVVVPPGLHPGMSIRLSVDSEEETENPVLFTPPVTYVSVKVTLGPSDPFEYEDNQLRITAQVPARTLVEGGEWTIPDPEGGDLTFKIPALTSSGSTLTIRKHGMRLGASSRRGNLFCTVVAEE